ncbi:MAG: alpha/beta fold hydrolase, partial [Propionibacteriaceae bacterium]|nr:alpha/beta fold hydrolase [Propionibacteriaceae bacterium]
MRTLYPAISPFAAEMMPVGQGQTLSVEQYGNPAGKPVVFLHGGPGAGTTPDQARFFDPERYRIVLFDQRGCGRSTPNAAEADYDLSANT